MLCKFFRFQTLFWQENRTFFVILSYPLLLYRNAFSEVEECFSIVKYRPEMKSVWIEIQKAAGQFDGYSNADIADYFEKTFLYDSTLDLWRITSK